MGLALPSGLRRPCGVRAGAGPASATAAGTVRAADDDVPAVTLELIAEHAAGLVVLLGPASDVGQAVAARQPDLARRALDRWRHLVPGTAVEIVDHLDHKSTFRAARLAELARDARVPAVLSNAVRYLDPAGSLAAQVLDAARHLVPLGSPKIPPHNGRAYLASPDDMTDTAKRVANAMTGPGTASAAAGLLAGTDELASRCVLDAAYDLGVGTRHLPETEGSAYDQHKELRDRCEHAILHGGYRTASAAGRPRGLSRLKAAQHARDRLEHELDIIAKTGMAAYFLTVADVAMRIRHAGIRCAIRGSGAGSFVNHLLGISAIDPLEHDLLMERFLSPIRATLPDIDLDVESARRLDAYRIIFDRYGAERTACVCMMETYRARSAIRDVAAAMSLPPDEIGAIAKAFPHIRAKHINNALAELPELRRSRLNDARLATIFKLAEQLDGLPRHVAMHPCGVLLSDRTLLNRTAVQKSGEGFPLSQLDKDDAEIAGVIKLDVLGVRMQSAMAHTLAEIRRTSGERVDIDAIARDDQATYAMIQRSETIGCFQIESPGQRELVKKLAPRDIADLIVDISLFRPGPVNSDMIGPFLRARHGLAEPRYPHEKLREALEGDRGSGGLPRAGAAHHRRDDRLRPGRGGPGPPPPVQGGRPGADRPLVPRQGPGPRLRPGDDRARLAGGRRVRRLRLLQGARRRVRHPRLPVGVAQAAPPGRLLRRRPHPRPRHVPQARHHRRRPPVRRPGPPGRRQRLVGRLDSCPPGRSPSSGTDARTPAPRHSPPGGPAADGPGPGCPPAGQAADPASPGHPRAGRSPARRLLESTGPLQALRLPGRRPSAPAASPQAIRCSLREVKGISDAEIARIVAGQPYTSLRDFWNRARVSRPVAERLVLIGAFDSLYPTPATGTRPATHPDPPLPTPRRTSGWPRIPRRRAADPAGPACPGRRAGQAVLPGSGGGTRPRPVRRTCRRQAPRRATAWRTSSPPANSASLTWRSGSPPSLRSSASTSASTS